MKKVGLLIGLLLVMAFCTAQRMELKELIELLDAPANKIDNHLSKKGFKRSGYLPPDEEAVLSFMRMKKDGSEQQYYWIGADRKYVYETPSQDEFKNLKNEIKAAGFFTPGTDTTSQSLVYQKKVITIETMIRSVEGIQYYVIKTSKKELPQKKAVLFAEDLLILDSHQYLEEMFGKENVKPDVFYYTEDDSVRCSVLFPHTNREAFVLWKDGEHLRYIELIIIGGTLRPTNETATSTVSFNTWRSIQGPYCGMSLKELVMLNKESIQFYNWHTESSGYLAPKNKGNLDFKTLGLVMSCMNCQFIKVSDVDIIDSDGALAEQQKVFVTTLVIVPDKK
jgi:hypothetical protein